MRAALLSRPPLQALAECSLAGILLTAPFLAFGSELPNRIISQAFELIVMPCCVLVVGLRLRIRAASRPLQAVEEIGIALLLSTVFYLLWKRVLQWTVSIGRDSAWRLNFEEEFYNIILVAAVGLSFLALRASLRLWRAWAKLRRQKLAFNLTHSYLTVMAVAAVVLVLWWTLARLPSLPFHEAETTWYSEIASSLVFGLAPPIGIGLFISALFLGLLAPVVAAVSFFVARGAAWRLGDLEHSLQELSAGNLAARTKVSGGDEIARLQRRFNDTADRLEKTVRELDREKAKVAALLQSRRKLFADAAHDLRTPVAVIRAWSENARAEPAQTESAIEAIERESVRLQRLIDDVFLLARCEENALRLNLARVDVSRLAAERVRSLQQAARRRKVVLSLDSPTKAPPAWADGDYVDRILANLLLNALDHTAEGGIVSVRLRSEDDQLTVSVRDTGSEGPLPDPEGFFQRNSSSRPGGSGLGLDIAKRLAQLMRGSLEGRPIDPQGMEFRLRLAVSESA